MSSTSFPRDSAAAGAQVGDAGRDTLSSQRHQNCGPAAALRGARVLIFDKDPVAREYARLLLLEYGVAAAAVADVDDACTTLTNGLIDLALLDFVTARDDGIRLLQRIRAEEALRTLPVVILTGETSEDAKLEGFRAGADDCLTKPYCERELLARVGGQLAIARMRQDVLEHESHRLSEADQLNEIALQLTSELDLKALGQKALDVGTSLTGAYCGTFFEFDTSGEQLRVDVIAVAGANREQLDAWGVKALLEDVAGALRQETIFRQPDMHPTATRGEGGRTPLRSCLAVPVVSPSHEVIGGLMFAHIHPGAFGSRAERFAKGVAAQAAVAIDNAHLYARARREIDVRTQAETALRDSQQRYQQLVQGLPVAVYTCDARGFIRLYNQAAQDLWGRAPRLGHDKWCGSHKLMRLSGEYLPLTHAPMAAAIGGQTGSKSVELYMETPDGVRRRVVHNPVPLHDDSGVLIGAVNMVLDVTEQREAEESRAWLAAVVETSSDAIISMTLDGEISSWNTGAASLYGYESQEVTGRHIEMLIPPERRDEEIKVLQRIRAGERIGDLETVRTTKDGRRVDVSLTISPVKDTAGRVIGISKIARDITARRHTEREIARLNEDLRARVQELETLQEVIPVGVFIAHDAECSIITTNRAGKAILQIEDGDPLFNISKSVPDSDRLLFRVCKNGRELDPADLPMQRCARTGEEVAGELYEQVFLDGTVKHTQISACPLFDADGQPRGCIATVVDISANMRAERAVRESESRFRTLTMNAPAAIYVKDSEGVYTMANPLACKYLGRSDAVGHSDYDLMPKDAADRLREHDLRVLVTGQPLEIEETVTVGGVSHEFLSAKFPLFNSERRIAGVCGVSVDITARKRAENALRQTMERTRLLAGVSERLLAADDPLEVVNDLCQRIATYLQCDYFSIRLLDETTGRLLLQTYDGIPDSELAATETMHLRSSMSGATIRDGRPRIASDLQHSDDPLTVHAKKLGCQAYACHPLQVAGRAIGTLSFATRTRTEFMPEEIGIMKTVADQVAMAMERLAARKALLDVNASLEDRVRERTQELLEQRRHLQRLASELSTAEQRERKRLASLLHDDLQQLLVSAKMLLGTLERRRDDPEDLIETCARAQQLIGDSIDVARDMSRQLRPPVLYEDGLVPALQWLATEMRRIHGLKITVSATESVEAAGDDQRAFLFECVRELLLNIVKHAGVAEAWITVERRGDENVRVIVSDEGRGFEAPHGIARQDPEGYGLFSIRERLASMGGRLTIESRIGAGTTATIEAPVLATPLNYDRPMLDPEAYRTTPVGPPGAGTRVLVVDDHALVREGIAAMIGEDPGFCVVGQAGDGMEAIEAVEITRPDIVLLDLNMPRMNGIEATRVIRRQWPGTIVVGLSVHEDETTARSVLEAGASRFLSKSSTPDQILATMRALIGVPQNGA